jgi:hypothetical protein
MRSTAMIKEQIRVHPCLSSAQMLFGLSSLTSGNEGYALLAPHFAQNFAPARMGAPQPAQTLAALSLNTIVALPTSMMSPSLSTFVP